jgi:hypothetical protein
MTYSFIINGRLINDYSLTNNQLIELLQGSEINEEERAFLTDKVIERFKYENCKRNGEETNDDVFARQMSSYVNGKMHNRHNIASLMANDHRYLQQETFKMFLEYAQILSDNYEKGHYDGRNEFACKCSNEIISALKDKKIL